MKINNFINWPFNFKLRLIFGVLFLFILAIFFNFKLMPYGKASFSRSWPNSFFSSRSNIFDFRPGIRIENNKAETLKVLSDPVYFSVYAPRTLDKAKVSITYFDNLSSETPIVELGVLKGNALGNYELRPLQNKIIDNLKFSWSRIVDDGKNLILQRDYNYSSEEEFWIDFKDDQLKNCSGGIINCGVFYNYPLTIDYKLPSYTKIYPWRITQALRGEHRFFVYFDQGEWYLNLSFRDLNLKEGADDIRVDVFLDDKLITSQTINDSEVLGANNAFDNNNRQGEKIKPLLISGLADKAALYKVEIKVNDDIVIEEIESSSDRLVFINKLWPVYQNNVSFFSNVNTVSFKNFETESLGEIYFAGESTILDRTYESVILQTVRTDSSLKEIRLEKSGIILELNGLISLKDDKFFNPNPSKLDRFFFLEDRASYLISSYVSPRKDGNFKTATVEFDLHDAYLVDNKYSFVISIPGLVLNTNNEGNEDSYLGIKKIEFEVEAKNLWQKIKEKIITK